MECRLSNGKFSCEDVYVKLDDIDVIIVYIKDVTTFVVEASSDDAKSYEIIMFCPALVEVKNVNGKKVLRACCI